MIAPDPSRRGLPTAGDAVGDNDRYVLEEHIATGGMGMVFRARDTVLGRTVAVKILKPEYADDALFRARFQSEGRTAARLHHPGIAAVFDASESAHGSAGPLAFLVMEYVAGRPLSQFLGRPLEPAAAAGLLVQAADALGAAHALGIVHRDIKPANLILTPERTLKVTDFGIARANEGVDLTESGQVLGTPSYLSPEQARGEAATPASDVYSLGVVAFEALTGGRPFVRATPVATALAHVQDAPPALPPSVPRALAAVIERTLSKDPLRRYADGAALAVALRAALGRPTGAHGAGSGGDAADAATQVLAPTAAATQVLAPTPAPTAEQATPAMSQPVPPTQALPPAPASRRTALWVGLTIAAIGTLAIVVMLWQQRTPTDPTDTLDPTPSPTSASPSTPTSSAPGAVEVDEDSYLGRPVNEVAAELGALGLLVTTREVPQQSTQSETPGAVSGVNPSGALNVGETVTVEFWGERPASPEPSPSPSPTEPTASASTDPSTDPSASATPQESATP